jgi:hypothetical protein
LGNGLALLPCPGIRGGIIVQHEVPVVRMIKRGRNINIVRIGPVTPGTLTSIRIPEPKRLLFTAEQAENAEMFFVFIIKFFLRDLCALCGDKKNLNGIIKKCYFYRLNVL